MYGARLLAAVLFKGEIITLATRYKKCIEVDDDY